MIIIIGLIIWFCLCFVAILYIDWITESFRRWLRFRKMKRIYIENEYFLASHLNERQEEIDLIQKQIGGDQEL